MNQFRDAMCAVAKDATGLRDNFFGERSDPVVDAILAMPEMQWIKQFLVDTLNTDFLSDYQCELVGEVPPLLLAWSDVDADWNES